MTHPARRSSHAISSIFALLLTAGVSTGLGGEALAQTAAASPAASMPPLITGATFDWSSHRRRARGSDNFPATWSDDDHQYAIWGDGGGFGGNEKRGRSSLGVARIEGDRDNYRGVNRYGGARGECRSNIDGKSHGAPFSIDGVLYAWITPQSGRRGYQRFTLYRSRDKGCSWRRLDVAFVREVDGVSYGSFVQFGRDNEAARDGYVYSIAVEATNTQSLARVQRPGRVMLLRVASTAMEDRGAYEFYAGLDSTGQPIWSSNSDAKAPIYEDANGVGPFPQMSYVPGLDRLVYTNEHGDGVTLKAHQSLLTMAEAPQPWGPWNVFYKDVFFPQIERSVFQWAFAPKWFQNGGREFTLIFSGIGENDSWNTVNGVFTAP